VIASQPLAARFVVTSALNAGGSFDLSVRNLGNLDAAPPAINLPSHCRLGDALGRYRLQSTTSSALQLVPDSEAWLAVYERMNIGWVRCDRRLQREWEQP